MSNRDAVPDSQKDVAWKRAVDDRLKALESRKVQGNLTLDTTTVNELIATASRDVPVQLVGSQTWTQDVEYLGVAPPGPGNGSDAIVTRNENGVIVDISPRPQVQYGAATPQNIATGVVTPLTLAGATATSGPYAVGAMSTAPGNLVLPVTGFWSMQFYGLWQALADATARLLFLQTSSNGGATFGDLFIADQANINTASFSQLQTVIGPFLLGAGTRVRISVLQTSAFTLAFTPFLFTASFLRGPL